MIVEVLYEPGPKEEVYTGSYLKLRRALHH